MSLVLVVVGVMMVVVMLLLGRCRKVCSMSGLDRDWTRVTEWLGGAT